MKKNTRFLALIVGSLLVCLGVGAWHVVSTLKEDLALTPGSLNYEIAMGAAGFTEEAGRLPQTKSELAIGLDKMKIKPSKLSNLQTVKFTRNGPDVRVRYTTSSGWSGGITITGL